MAQQVQQNDNGEARVDDFYFSAMFDEPETDIFPISDSKYAEELQFQEALMSSTQQQTANQKTTTTTIETTSIASFFQTSNPETTTTTLASTSKSPPPVVRYNMSFGDELSGEELVDSSRMLCAICADVKPAEEKFAAAGENDIGGEFACDNSFCLECIGKHVSAKLQENLHVIPCPAPDCKGVHVLEIDKCRQILPKEVVERWDEALCVALVSSGQRFYCPFRDCSSLMIREEELNEELAESECPACHRLFCARCEHAPWHAGIGCDEFQRLSEDDRGRDDLLVTELASQKKWKRCPKCLFFVEKLDGCLHITCRCTFQFCYSCGKTWTETHGGCQTE